MQKDSSGNYSKKRTRKKRQSYPISVRGNASLSILTAGNEKFHGFANARHLDKYDEWDKMLREVALKILDEMKKYSETDEATQNYKIAYKHLVKLSTASVNGTFSSYTTCGYNIFFEPENKKKKALTPFYYADANVAVEIPKNKVCYHTFGGYMHSHQTVFPITYDDEYVYFNDPDLFALAWGNGKSEKRIYLENRGAPIVGRNVASTDISTYFGNATEDEKNEIRGLGWMI